MIPTREQAWQLLTEYTQSEALLIHAKTVEGVMRHFARLRGEDESLWGVVGLLHDLDYEKYPDEHCKKGLDLMRQHGLDEIVCRGCASHGHGICIDLEPISDMEKTLYTIDELTGLIAACAIMRPSKSVMDLELKSVKKKYKTKSFAAGVSREVIEDGAARLSMPLDDVISETILGMREVAADINLLGAVE